GALRHRAAAAHSARLLRQTTGPNPVRQGFISAGGVSLLLAGVLDQRRLLRLLSALPRVLEALRNRFARRSSEEGVLPERSEDHAGTAPDGVAALNGPIFAARL